jgi:hypothetical protein
MTNTTTKTTKRKRKTRKDAAIEPLDWMRAIACDTRLSRRRRWRSKPGGYLILESDPITDIPRYLPHSRTLNPARYPKTFYAIRLEYMACKDNGEGGYVEQIIGRYTKRDRAIAACELDRKER